MYLAWRGGRTGGRRGRRKGGKGGGMGERTPNTYFKA